MLFFMSVLRESLVFPRLYGSVICDISQYTCVIFLFCHGCRHLSNEYECLRFVIVFVGNILNGVINITDIALLLLISTHAVLPFVMRFFYAGSTGKSGFSASTLLSNTRCFFLFGCHAEL